MITKSLLGPKRREKVDDLFNKVIDPRSNLAHQGGIAGVPSQTANRPQTGDLVEVVADGGQFPPGCSDGIKLVCLDGQTIACLSDQMPDCLGNRQTACLGNCLKGCMLVFCDADVQLYRKPPHLLPVKAAFDPRQRLPGTAHGPRQSRDTLASEEPRRDGGSLSRGQA